MSDSEEDIDLTHSADLYDDTINIVDYPSSFNLTDGATKPDIRSFKYKSSTEHLNCPICQQPFIEPMTTICGHTFCKECIKECFKMAKNLNGDDQGVCPLDRTLLDGTNINDLFPTPLIISNLIDDLKVYCVNYERGCEWVGCRWEVDHHVINDCGYTGVRCNGTRTNEEGSTICRKLVERRFLQNNNDNDNDNNDKPDEIDDKEQICVHKLFQCKYCNTQLTKISEQDHLANDCLFNYQTCEICLNDCIPMKNLEKHKQNCTRAGHIQCPANVIGCKWVGVNQTSLEIHVEQNCPLNAFLPYYNKMTESVENLTKENNFLQRQINKILDSIIQGKITNLGYNETIEEINKFEDEDKLLYINFEIDKLKFEINEKINPILNQNKLQEQDNIINKIINENFIIREDLNLQRILISNLRKQLHFLLFRNSEDPLDLVEISSRSLSEERLNLKL